MTSTSTVEELFDSGIERYKQGEAIETLIPMFKEVCDRAPKNSSSWTCLAWLYLLAGKSESGYKAAQKAVKLNPQDPQARVNLAIAMIETGKKGVREHIEITQQILMISEELKQEITESLADGLARKADWSALQRVQGWLAQ